MIAIYYEHPDWFRPLFAELERRGTPYQRLFAGSHRFDPSERPPWSLVFNRMSPSAWQRGNASAVFYALNWLNYLEARGVRVINGYGAFLTEISKAAQLALLEQLGLPYPRSRVIDRPSRAWDAAHGLRFPI